MNEFQLYFRLGLEHILSFSSWDHLLFLTGLIVVFELKEYKKIIGVISLFALAHTFSLFFSAKGIIRINGVLVEKAILYTILITALSNLLITNIKWLTKAHYFFAFFFGLIHGLGFARDFKMMVSGQKNMIAPLIEFTIGIETGQIIASSVILLLIFVLSKILPFNRKELTALLSAFIIGYTLALMH